MEQSLREGRHAIYDADLAGYFDTIPHDSRAAARQTAVRLPRRGERERINLIAGVRERIVDGRVLALIEQWLDAPVMEPPDDKNGGAGKGPTSRMTRRTQGTPQGGVLSPLLANIHLHWFDRAFNGKEGPAHWANARLVRYADDFVILARYMGERIENWVEEKIERRLGLTINLDKTRVIVTLKADGEKLDFLGYSLRHAHDQYGQKGKKYLSTEPSAKAQQRMREKVRQILDSKQSHTPLPELIERLNASLRGWANYFEYGYPRQAFRGLNSYVRTKLTWHLQRRSQRPWKPPGDQSAYAHLNQMGLIQL